MRGLGATRTRLKLHPNHFSYTRIGFTSLRISSPTWSQMEANAAVNGCLASTSTTLAVISPAGTEPSPSPGGGPRAVWTARQNSTWRRDVRGARAEPGSTCGYAPKDGVHHTREPWSAIRKIKQTLRVRDVLLNRQPGP